MMFYIPFHDTDSHFCSSILQNKTRISKDEQGPDTWSILSDEFSLSFTYDQVKYGRVVRVTCLVCNIYEGVTVYRANTG